MKRESLAPPGLVEAAKSGEPAAWRPRLVLEHGRGFVARDWTYWRGRGYRAGKATDCYRSAARLAADHHELIYVEGYAYGLAHAWCATEDGDVADPVWRKIGPPIDKRVCFGIPFALPFVSKIVAETGRWGVIEGLGDLGRTDRLPIDAIDRRLSASHPPAG